MRVFLHSLICSRKHTRPLISLSEINQANYRTGEAGSLYRPTSAQQSDELRRVQSIIGRECSHLSMTMYGKLFHRNRLM